MTTTLFSLVALTALAVPPEVTVRPLEGESLQGRLAALSPAELRLATTAGQKELVERIRGRLQLYTARRPYRQAPGAK